MAFEYRIHLRDALIVACMKENDIVEIVTENKIDFEKIPEIKVTIPFQFGWVEARNPTNY